MFLSIQWTKLLRFVFSLLHVVRFYIGRYTLWGTFRSSSECTKAIIRVSFSDKVLSGPQPSLAPSPVHHPAVRIIRGCWNHRELESNLLFYQWGPQGPETGRHLSNFYREADRGGSVHSTPSVGTHLPVHPGWLPLTSVPLLCRPELWWGQRCSSFPPFTSLALPPGFG